MLPIATSLKPVKFIVTAIKLKNFSVSRPEDNQKTLSSALLSLAEYDTVLYLFVQLITMNDLRFPFLSQTSPYLEVLFSAK